MKTGRKSFTEELQIKERYSALTPKFFRVLEKFLNSKYKGDQKWAIEQLNKAYIRMIPQQITGEGGNPLEIKVINYAGTSSLPLSTKNISAPISSGDGRRHKEGGSDMA